MRSFNVVVEHDRQAPADVLLGDQREGAPAYHHGRAVRARELGEQPSLVRGILVERVEIGADQLACELDRQVRALLAEGGDGVVALGRAEILQQAFLVLADLAFQLAQQGGAGIGEAEARLHRLRPREARDPGLVQGKRPRTARDRCIRPRRRRWRQLRVALP